MWTNFRLFPSDKSRVPVEKEKLMLCHMPKSIGWYENFLLSVFLPAALRAACWQLVWHVCQASFTLNCIKVWHLIHIKGCAATLFSLCCNAILDHRLMWLSDSALRCVEWNFGSEKYRTVHAYMYSAGCSKIYCSSAIFILKYKILMLTTSRHVHVGYNM